MKEDFHIDLSNKFYSKKTTGIAFVGAKTKINKGCGISNRIKRYIEKNLFDSSVHKDRAKLHAICIYYLIKEDIEIIKRLIICNDEIFSIVKDFLTKLFKTNKIQLNFEIINITEYRKILGRKVNSLADNYARVYAKRSLKPWKWKYGKKINVIEITYDMIKDKWELLK